MSIETVYPKCSECVYWVHIDKGVGECRLHPPVLNADPVPPVWEFPSSRWESWCGDGRKSGLKRVKK